MVEDDIGFNVEESIGLLDGDFDDTGFTFGT